MANLYRDWDKAELHVHLEGSIEPATILELEPSLTAEEVQCHLSFSDFSGFLRSYIWVNRLLRTPRDYGLIASRVFESMERENIRYAEVTVSAGVVLWKEQNFDAVFAELQQAAAESRVRVRWILDAIRQFGVEPATHVARLAVRYRDEGVVAFGIGGDEAAGPVNWFTGLFAYVHDNGLHVVPHAGETVGPESVWDAMYAGARRIGHGVAAAEDPELMAVLRQNDISLEICISSNVCTGAVADLAAHPLRALFDAGVPLTLNTDDPALFRCTLSSEFELARMHFGFTDDELRAIAANSFRYALDWSPETKVVSRVSND